MGDRWLNKQPNVIISYTTSKAWYSNILLRLHYVLHSTSPPTGCTHEKWKHKYRFSGFQTSHIVVMEILITWSLPEDHMPGFCIAHSKLTSASHQVSWRRQEKSTHSGTPTQNRPSWTGLSLPGSSPTIQQGQHPAMRNTQLWQKWINNINYD